MLYPTCQSDLKSPAREILFIKNKLSQLLFGQCAVCSGDHMSEFHWTIVCSISLWYVWIYFLFATFWGWKFREISTFSIFPGNCNVYFDFIYWENQLLCRVTSKMRVNVKEISSFKVYFFSLWYVSFLSIWCLYNWRFLQKIRENDVAK